MTQFLNATAVVIGVRNYAYLKPDLPAARSDAEDVAALLRDPSACGYDPNKVHLLRDSEASVAAVGKLLGDLARTVLPDESFLLYFSGHGHRAQILGREQSYLLMADSKISRLESTALGDAELLSRLRDIPSHRQVMILDACHAGGVGTLKNGEIYQMPLGIAKSAVDRLTHGTGLVILTSSRADEVSVIPAGWRNSLFTDSLIRALRGEARDKGDGTIGVFDAFRFVADDVPRHANQHPVFKADGLEADFSIARLGVSQAKASADPPAGSLAELFARFYPTGPLHSEIWSRAGGDVSRLTLTGNGRAQWHSAVVLLNNGGGGTSIDRLLREIASDFPDNLEVRNLQR